MSISEGGFRKEPGAETGHACEGFKLCQSWPWQRGGLGFEGWPKPATTRRKAKTIGDIQHGFGETGLWDQSCRQ